MEPTRSYGGGGSGNSGTYSPENAESLRFEEEIQSLMLHPTYESPPVTGSSFTALLGLPPTEAVELLHLPLGCSPTFPLNAALVDRAARFSVFAAEGSPEVSNSGGIVAKLKAEPADSGDRTPSQWISGKRKEADKPKVRGSAAKKNKCAEEKTGGEEKLPYVHVRARRGQATDSHSLAERARREKINARMKLLQELVPGCSKISGTALVLDEIINHVQSLQRQVEFLSMRLAAVNPRVDFGGLDNILSSECGRLMASSGKGAIMMEQLPWLDGMIAGAKHHPQQHQEQIWLIDHHQQQQQQQVWDRDDTQQSHVPICNASTNPSVFCYDSTIPPTSVSLPSQLKTEL